MCLQSSRASSRAAATRRRPPSRSWPRYVRLGEVLMSARASAAARTRASCRAVTGPGLCANVDEPLPAVTQRHCSYAGQLCQGVQMQACRTEKLILTLRCGLRRLAPRSWPSRASPLRPACEPRRPLQRPPSCEGGWRQIVAAVPYGTVTEVVRNGCGMEVVRKPIPCAHARSISSWLLHAHFKIGLQLTERGCWVPAIRQHSHQIILCAVWHSMCMPHACAARLNCSVGLVLRLKAERRSHVFDNGAAAVA